MERKKLVIPSAMYPASGMHEVTGKDGKIYLLKNEAMFTGYQHSRAEFSEFFMAIRDRCEILGKRCSKCRHVIVPPFMLRCPACNFNEMDTMVLRDIGFMLASPVITMFAPSRFKNEVPFGTGYVQLAYDTGDGCILLTNSAIPLRMRTTTGTMRPGIFKKDMPVKIIFADERIGDIADIFAVPSKELSFAERTKIPLLEKDLDWSGTQIILPAPRPQDRDILEKISSGLKLLGTLARKSRRATKNLKNWERRVEIKTPAGYRCLMIKNGELSINDGKSFHISFFLMQPEKFAAWLVAAANPASEQVPALTDLIMDGSLVMSKPEIETITRLDRLPRSLRRDGII